MLGYLAKAGLAPSHALGPDREDAGREPGGCRTARLILARDYAPRFPVALIAKDFRYAVDSAQKVGAELPVTDAVRELFETLRDTGFGAENMSAVARLFLPPAG